MPAPSTTASNERMAISFGLLAVGMWSTVATAFKIALSYLDVLQLLFIANAASVAALSLLIIIKINSLPKYWWKAHWARSFAYGLLNPTLYYWVLFAAYDHLPAQIAQPINYTWALVLSFLAAWRFGHKLKTVDWIAFILGYAGVMILILPGQENSEGFSWLGVALAIASTLLWASYWVLNQGETRPPLLGLWQSFICALPVNAVLVLLFSDFPAWDVKAWCAGFYVGAFEMGFAFAAWLMALRYTQHTARISNLIFLSPLLSLCLIHWVLGEPIYDSTPIGLGFILFGLFVQQQGEKLKHQLLRFSPSTRSR